MFLYDLKIFCYTLQPHKPFGAHWIICKMQKKTNLKTVFIYDEMDERQSPNVLHDAERTFVMIKLRLTLKSQKKMSQSLHI